MIERDLRYGRVELVHGNIVDQETDAIVNAANTKLAGGGGVDGAIHRAAGKELKRLCEAFPADDRGRRCETGDVRTTRGCQLDASYVIHAVGPYYNERYAEKARAQLRTLHRRALEAAVEHDCRSVAFPAISTGAYRFPFNEAAAIAVDEVCRFLDDTEGLELVRFVLFKPAHLQAFAGILEFWEPRKS